MSAPKPYRLPLWRGPHYDSDILDSDGATVAMGCPCFTEVGAKRAADIIRAVNAHDDLVAALRSVEWGALDASHTRWSCPSCCLPKEEGHSLKCVLNAALSRAAS